MAKPGSLVAGFVAVVVAPSPSAPEIAKLRCDSDRDRSSTPSTNPHPFP